MQDARICLWRNDDALEVATFYTELFDDAEIQEVRPAVRPEDADLPAGRGVGLTVDFRVGPLLMQTLNGGDDRDYDESMSVAIITEDQDETDRVWEALIADGGREDRCGWCVDRYGVRWQVVPREVMQAFESDDAGARGRAMEVMMTQTRMIVEPSVSAARSEG